MPPPAPAAGVPQVPRRHRRAVVRREPGVEIHLVLDNYGTHKTPAVKRWFLRHPEYHLHFTPTSGSWLNQVERFFAEITEKRIRRGCFRERGGAGGGDRGYLEHTTNSQAVRLDRDADLILNKVRKLAERLAPPDKQPATNFERGYQLWWSLPQLGVWCPSPLLPRQAVVESRGLGRGCRGRRGEQGGEWRAAGRASGRGTGTAVRRAGGKGFSRGPASHRYKQLYKRPGRRAGFALFSSVSEFGATGSPNPTAATSRQTTESLQNRPRRKTQRPVSFGPRRNRGAQGAPLR